MKYVITGIDKNGTHFLLSKVGSVYLWSGNPNKCLLFSSKEEAQNTWDAIKSLAIFERMKNVQVISTRKWNSDIRKRVHP